MTIRIDSDETTFEADLRGVPGGKLFCEGYEVLAAFQGATPDEINSLSTESLASRARPVLWSEGVPLESVEDVAIVAFVTRVFVAMEKLGNE